MAQNPFRQVEQLIDEMDEQFSHARMRLGGEIGTTAVDVAEWDGEFLVMADLPGFEKQDIDLRITDHTLHIEAEHKAEERLEEEHYLHRERAWTDVSRTVPLPEDIDESGVSATYENGVLTVTLPKAKAEETGAKTIPIS